MATGRTCEVSIVLRREAVLIHDGLAKDDGQVLRVGDVLDLGSHNAASFLIDYKQGKKRPGPHFYIRKKNEY